MYNFYLHDKNNEQSFTNYVGTISLEEARSLDIVWKQVEAETGYDFPKAVLDDPVVPLEIVRTMYNIFLSMHIKNNPELFVAHNVKKPYMILYENILSILDNAIKNDSDLWVEMD